MIDWYNLIANLLWIIALALALSVVSIARWEARAKGQKLRDALNTNRWLVTLNTAGITFCGGMAALSDPLWEQVVWLLLLVTFCLQTGVWLLPGRKS
jgi:hypothetical protein